MKKKAFTLIELLVVIAIIGLLASIVLVNLTGQRQKARIAKGLQFSQSVHHALGAYALGVWRFDEGAGNTAHDSSGYGNDGTLINNPSWRCAADDSTYTPSGQGCSLEFNGPTQQVTVSHDDTITPREISVSLWFKMNLWDGNRQILLVKWYGYSVEVGTDKRPYFRIRNGGDSVKGPILDTNAWYHFVGTYKPGIGNSLYINGDFIGTVPRDTEIEHSTNSLQIGRYTDNLRILGLIDEVRIYNQTLKTSQIESLYYAGLDNLLEKGLINLQEYQERLALR